MSSMDTILDIYNKQVQSLLSNQKIDILTQRANTLQAALNKSVYNNQLENALKIITNTSQLINYTNNVSNLNALIIANEKKSKNDNYSVKRSNDYAIITSLVENITNDETDSFFDFISESPMLAYKNKTGKSIYDAIAKNNKTKYLKNNELYRVRVPKEKNIKYSFREMFSPQYGESTHGRFSFIGINYLYFSESLQDALLETKADIDKKYTYIKVSNNKDFALLDITNLKIPLFNRCHIGTSQESTSLKTEYLIPNYIANCAYDNNYDGILYNSVSGEGRNLVLFGAGYSDFDEIETVGKNY